MEIKIRINDEKTETVKVLDYVPGSIRSKVAPLYAKLGSVDIKDEAALMQRMFSHPVAQQMLDGLTEEQIADKDIMSAIGIKLMKNKEVLADLFFNIGDDEDSVNAAYSIAQIIIIKTGISKEALAIIEDLETFINTQDSNEVYEIVRFFRGLLSRRK